jgi:hypothetical protein
VVSLGVPADDWRNDLSRDSGRNAATLTLPMTSTPNRPAGLPEWGKNGDRSSLVIGRRVITRPAGRAKEFLAAITGPVPVSRPLDERPQQIVEAPRGDVGIILRLV